MKNNDLHARAVEIITDNMNKVLSTADHGVDNKGGPVLREYNTDSFL